MPNPLNNAPRKGTISGRTAAPIMPPRRRAFLLIGWVLSGVPMGALADYETADPSGNSYRIPHAHPEFRFPRSHGSHPDYRIEWWYLTGHLKTADGRRFGWQATFFRTGAPRPFPEDENPAFRTDQLHLAHMALTDIEGQQFHHAERLDRAGWDADASTDSLRLRQGPWSLELIETTPGAERLQLKGGVPGSAHWDLALSPSKPLVIFGEDGRSRKGAPAEAVSWYLSWTRLEAQGHLEIGGQTTEVTGLAWMDHEISSYQLGTELVGWDWVGIHLDDGREIKAYRLRQSDGTPSPWSRCIWIDRQGLATSQGPALANTPSSSSHEALRGQTPQAETHPDSRQNLPLTSGDSPQFDNFTPERGQTPQGLAGLGAQTPERLRGQTPQGSAEPKATPEGARPEGPPSVFSWIERGYWKTPDGLARYPTRVEIRTQDPETGQPVQLWLEPVLEDQELRGRTRYWEGACMVTDPQGRPMGRAYLELVGYAPGELRGLRPE